MPAAKTEQNSRFRARNRLGTRVTALEKEMRGVRSEMSRRSARPASQNSTLHSVAKPSVVAGQLTDQIGPYWTSQREEVTYLSTGVFDERCDSKYGINPT